MLETDKLIIYFDPLKVNKNLFNLIIDKHFKKVSFTNIQNISVGPGYNIIVSENKNNENLGTSHHLDISANKSIKFTKFGIDVGCSVYNLYNNKNISHKRYNPYTQGISIKDIAMFGITPSFFIKATF